MMRELYFFREEDAAAVAANVYPGDDVAEMAKGFGAVRIETPEGEQVWPPVQPTIELPAVRFCIDCEFHHTRGPSTYPAHFCRFPSTREPEISLVTGEPKALPSIYQGCDAMREESDQCGPEAAWFAARNS